MKWNLALILAAGIGMCGCNEPVVPSPASPAAAGTGSPNTLGIPPVGSGNSSSHVHVPSAGEIAAEKERHYASQLQTLQARDPQADAQAVIQRGERYFLCNAGRSATVPGLSAEVYAAVRDRCEVRCLDGVTDVLYGENHRRYLSAALAYSARWNAIMLAACR